MLNKLLSISLCAISLTMVACSNQSVINQAETAKINNVSVVDVGQGKIGASFSAKVNFKEGFAVKANTNGAIAKTNANISTVDAYLIELATAPTAGSDPLASKVAGPINLAKTGTGFTVLFKNVPENAAGKSYYIGLVAKDTGGIVISKNPATDWSGASANKGLAVSTTGGDGAGSVSVNASLTVSNAADLGVAISLLDAVGAQVQSTATVTNGSPTLPTITAN